MMLPIIIPVYRKPEQVEKCEAAIRSQAGGITPLVYKIDNNETNRGFTKAINQGLIWAIEEEHPYAVALNQDCYLRPTALIEMRRFMDRHPRCAVAGIKQLSSTDEDIIVHGGCGQAYPNGHHFVGRVSAGDCSESAPMPWVNGACMIFRLDALKQIGLLDENMFLIGSDSDICYTARLRGWEVWYCPDAVCVHEQGVSAAPPSDEVLAIMRKDMEYWGEKWVGSQAFTRLSRSFVFQ